MKLLKTALLTALFLPAVSFADELDNRTQSSTFPKPGEVQSQSDMRPHLGLLIGNVTPEGDYKNAINYGLDFGFQPYVPFSVGIEANHSKIENDANESHERTLALVKGAYNFGGDIPVIRDSFVGVGVGPMIVDGTTLLASAPMVGFDIPLSDKRVDLFTLGAAAKYVIVEGSEPDNLQINGAIKYWF